MKIARKLLGMGGPAVMLAALAVLAGCAEVTGASSVQQSSSGTQIGSGNMVTGSGNAKTESRPVTGLSAVTLEGIGHLTISQTGTESLTITADDNLLPYLTSDVSGGRLTLGVKSGTSITTKTPVDYKLTVKDLAALDVTGSGDATMDRLNSPSLEVTVSGSGSVKMAQLSGSSVRATCTGSGGITLSGQTQRVDVRVSGSGAYSGGDLASSAATVQVTGSGDATVNARDTLDATVLGSGSVRYMGNPTVTQQVTGSGSVRKA